MSFILSLPDVVLATVLSSWMTAADVAQLDSALCNKESRDAILNIAYKRTTVLRIPSLRFPVAHSTMMGMIMWVLTKQAAVTELFVTKQVSTPVEAYLATRGTTVQRITIYRDSPESLFECVAKYCPNLVEYFSQETHGDQALVMLAQNCPKLQEVRLTGSYTDATISALARNCHQLRKVRLEPRTPLSEKALTELIKNCPDLVSLITGLSYEGNLTLSDAFLEQLAQSCPSIEELELVGADITEAGMNALAGRCVKLRTLSLNYGRVFIGGAHSALPLHALTFLKLYDVNLHDGDLRALISRCPGLQSLGLSCLTELTEAGLVEAVAQLPPLRLLFLGHSQDGIITDVVLRSIARRGRELRTLTLHCLSDVTDNGFAALVHSSPLLESIDLEGMENSDASLRALTWFGASLRRARFSNCRIGNAGVNALVEGCPHLTQLTVHECDRVGKVAMRKVAKFLPYQE